MECPRHAGPGALPCHCARLPCCVSFNKQQRLACKQQFPPGWTAKKRKFICGSTRGGSRTTSPLSWTATADGRGGATCPASPDTALESGPCARRLKPRLALEYLRLPCTLFPRR